MLKHLALAAACLFSAPALATETIFCSSPDGVASLSMNAGRLEVLSINNATMQVRKLSWSTHPDLMPGTPMVIGQAYADAEQMFVDVLDADYATTIARARIFLGSEDGEHVAAGVLTVPGQGAFPLVCEGE